MEADETLHTVPGRILVFVPAYNCEKQIARVLEKFDANISGMVDQLIVVENRSTDNTLEMACSAISKLDLPAKVLQNRENYSLGGSIKVALLYALEEGFDYVVVVHGDDQADVRDLAESIRNRRHEANDLLIGARFLPESRLQGYSRLRIAGNLALNRLVSVLARRKIHDLIAGLNIYRTNFFQNRVFLNFPDSLTFDAHLLLYAINTRASFSYLPISWREEDQISNAKAFRQGLIILRLMLTYVLRGKRVFLVNASGRPDDFSYPSDVIASANL